MYQSFEQEYVVNWKIHGNYKTMPTRGSSYGPLLLSLTPLAPGWKCISLFHEDSKIVPRLKGVGRCFSNIMAGNFK